jgi:dihydroxy-acid dehydratase
MMPMLQGNVTAGTTRWAVRRAQWKAMGITEVDFAKPKIAVVNSSSGLSVCFAHLDELARLVAEEIRAAGGLPFEIRTTAPVDFITSAGGNARYILPARDLIVNDIEVVVEGAQLDAMVCLASCDKTTPGQLMATVRLDVGTAAHGLSAQPRGGGRR